MTSPPCHLFAVDWCHAIRIYHPLGNITSSARFTSYTMWDREYNSMTDYTTKQRKCYKRPFQFLSCSCTETAGFRGLSSTLPERWQSLISCHRSLIWSGWSLSHAPQQQVVGAVVSSHCFTAAVQPEVLVAVSTADHQQSGFTSEEGGGPALLHSSVTTQLWDAHNTETGLKQEMKWTEKH